jgi:hypothetical protein
MGVLLGVLGMPEATPRQRAEARVARLLPVGWVLDDPEPFDGGWRLSVHNASDPNIEIGVWELDLELAIMSLAAELEKKRPLN